jgi:hypothetical protein
MSFMHVDGGWYCQFLEPDLKTPLPRKLTFAHADKVREVARRGEALGTSEAKQILEHAIEMGTRSMAERAHLLGGASSASRILQLNVPND